MGIKDINSTLKSVISDVMSEITKQKQKSFYDQNITPLQIELSNIQQEYMITQDYNLYLKYNELTQSIQFLSQQLQLIKCDDIGFTTIPLSFFTGSRIAIDTSIIINAKMNIAHNDLLSKQTNMMESYSNEQLMIKTKKLILGFIGTLLSYNITPVFILDGQSHPAKTECILKRVEEKKKRQSNVQILLNAYNALSPLDRTKDVEDNLTNALMHTVKITQHDKDNIVLLLKELGFPCLKAQHDGEVLCSALCREGIVSAVYGDDTDNYPLGTRILIRELSFENSTHVCKIVNLEQVKWALSMNFGRQIDDLSFIDLCILHGCDYNNNTRLQIPQKQNPSKFKSVGGKGALDLIKQYGYFENFPPAYKYYFESLKIDICRNFFIYKNSGVNEIECNIDWDIFYQCYTQILQSLNCEGYTFANFRKADPRILKINTSQFDVHDNNIPQFDVHNNNNLTINNSHNNNTTYGGFVM